MRFPPALAAPLNAVPVFVIETAAGMIFSRVLSCHPGLFSRLDEHIGKRFGFVPDDLPVSFVVSPAGPSIRVMRKPGRPEADAVVEGPLFLLLALLEGRCDADALFFSRELSVTGDMEAMLALRNALDDCDVDLPADLGAAAGPLGPLVTGLGERLREKVLRDREAATWN